ncbi:MAG: hypothetical protein KGQ93_05840 [Cyanobacteria bacterium REEB459]|nr:hypothetical protein [Cyanobacteria bacterium REEB459]
MQLSTSCRFSLGLAALLCLYPGLVLAQGTRAAVQGLEENPGLIRQCRQINQRTSVFDNTTLGPVTNRLGTLEAGSKVSLTGVVTGGRAQIFLPGNFNGLSKIQPVGWVNAAFLASCGGSPPPTGKACFRAKQSLHVRSNPSTNGSIVANYNTGDIAHASSNPPTRRTPGDGYTWLEVIIYNNSRGWVAETSNNGKVQNLNSVACP